MSIIFTSWFTDCCFLFDRIDFIVCRIYYFSFFSAIWSLLLFYIIDTISFNFYSYNFESLSGWFEECWSCSIKLFSIEIYLEIQPFKLVSFKIYWTSSIDPGWTIYNSDYIFIFCRKLLMMSSVLEGYISLIVSGNF